MSHVMPDVSGQGYSVVSLGPEDLEQVLAIEQTVAGGWSRGQLQGEFDHLAGWQFGVRSASDEKIMAFVMGRTVVDEAEILRLVVDQKWRRKGLATFLLIELIRFLKQQSCKICHLEVRSSNLAALRLYGKNGFEEVGRRRNYYHNPSEDAVLMAIQI